MPPSSQTILMCAPDHYGVSYVINPWMEGHFTDTSRALAQQQWKFLCEQISKQVQITLQPPQSGLPDLVFTANAGLVLGNKVIVSRFRNVERQGEEPYDHQWFKENGFEILNWPQDVPFEGAGDALFDRGQKLLWAGQGFRSDAKASPLLEKMLGVKIATLKMINPRFYHLDTCLCPLAGGYMLYYPGAFDDASRALIEKFVPEGKRIPVDEADAMKFCCNAVDLNGHIYTNGASDDLQKRIKKAGFTTVITPLSEFLKAGGGAKCLTLKLLES
jgi:N-dimethylarginine dimethylaminohydrolase